MDYQMESQLETSFVEWVTRIILVQGQDSGACASPEAEGSWSVDTNRLFNRLILGMMKMETNILDLGFRA